MAYEFDLALFLIIVSAIVFSFLEVNLTWGFISLIVGTVIFAGWIHHRTKLFK